MEAVAAPQGEKKRVIADNHAPEGVSFDKQMPLNLPVTCREIPSPRFRCLLIFSLHCGSFLEPIADSFRSPPESPIAPFAHHDKNEVSSLLPLADGVVRIKDGLGQESERNVRGQARVQADVRNAGSSSMAGPFGFALIFSTAGTSVRYGGFEHNLFQGQYADGLDGLPALLELLTAEGILLSVPHQSERFVITIHASGQCTMDEVVNRLVMGMQLIGKLDALGAGHRRFFGGSVLRGSTCPFAGRDQSGTPQVDHTPADEDIRGYRPSGVRNLLRKSRHR